MGPNPAEKQPGNSMDGQTISLLSYLQQLLQTGITFSGYLYDY